MAEGNVGRLQKMLAAGFAALVIITGEAVAKDGFVLKCPPNNGPCTITVIPAPSGGMRWYSKVYVKGDGNIGRVKVNNRDECQRLCVGHADCVVAEFYFGSETRTNLCNMFSYPVPMERNSSGDAQVGVYE